MDNVKSCYKSKSAKNIGFNNVSDLTSNLTGPSRGIKVGHVIKNKICRDKNVDFAERHRGDFAFKLSGDRQACGLAEEVVRVVFCFSFIFPGILVFVGGDGEHLTGAFTVRARDYRGVDIDIVSFLEIVVDGLSED